MQSRSNRFIVGLALAGIILAQPLRAQDLTALTKQQRSEIGAMVAQALEQDRQAKCDKLVALKSEQALLSEAAQMMCPGEAAAARKTVAERTTSTQAEGGGSVAAKTRHAIFVKDLPPATLDSPVDRGGSRFEASTTNESGRAGIRLSSDAFDCQRSSPGETTKSACSLSMTLSAPINKTGDTNIATLSGFANASTLAVDFTRFTLTGAITPTPEQLTAFVTDAGLDMSVLGTDRKEPDVDLDGLYGALKEAGKLDLYDQAVALFFKPDSLRWNWGANATIGYESDDYFNPTTLAAANRKAEPWSVGLYGGLYPGKNSYISGAFDLAHAYKAAKNQTLCPTGGGGVVECVTGSFGPPKETEKHLVSLSARAQTEDKTYAAALTLTHDVKSGDSGADLPIYLFNDPKHALNGGLRLGWTNTDHFTAGVFVGSTFSLDGN